MELGEKEGIFVKHSTADDALGVKAIFEGEQACSGTFQNPYASIKLWEKRLQELPDRLHSLVAEKQGKIVGHLVFESFENPRRKHVGSFGLAVHDDYHGQGVGDCLLMAAIDLADNWLNLKRIEMTVFTDNEAAIQLYKKHGFNIEGESAAYAFRKGEYVSAYHMGRVRSE